METKLTDFTAEQLQVLVAAISLLKRERSIGYFQSHAEDDVNLVRTQILTAVGQVAMKDKVFQG